MAVRTMDTIWQDTVDPTVNDDNTIGVQVGDEWRNTSSGEVFFVSDVSTGAAVWSSSTEALTGTYVTIAGPVEFTSDAILVAPTIAANQNDYNPNDGVKDFNTGGRVNVAILVIDATSNVNITGLVAPSPAKTMRVIIFNNSATNNITLQNNNAGSVAANRFLSNGNVTINEKESVECFYSVSEQRWIPITR